MELSSQKPEKQKLIILSKKQKNLSQFLFSWMKKQKTRPEKIFYIFWKKVK